jgi:hypothetical protein
MPGRIVAFAPIDAPALTIVVRNLAGRCRLRGKMSFANVAFGPMKTSSSMTTPSQSCTPHFTVTRSPTVTSFSMNVWSQMLQSAPMRAPAGCARTPRRGCAARRSSIRTSPADAGTPLTPAPPARVAASFEAVGLRRAEALVFPFTCDLHAGGLASRRER